MIHVCYGLYDKFGRYSKFVGTSIASLFENTKSEVTVHILHDNTLTADNKNKFESLAKNFNQQIKFYNVEVLYADKVENFRKNLSAILDTNFSIGTLYRLLIPQILSDLKKIIYLDADIIVNLDINELWQNDLENFPIAAVAEIDIVEDYDRRGGAENYLIQNNFVDVKKYFNAGVLILNIPELKKAENLLNEKTQFVAATPECTWFDQDILNLCFSENYLRLPNKFDVYVNYRRIVKRDQKISPAIYHYIGNSLNFDMRDNYNRLWTEYFFKTAWLNVEMFSHIYDCVQELDIQTQEKLLNLSAKMSGKRRIFFAELNNFEALKNLFKIDKSEEIIDGTQIDAEKILLKKMKKLRGAGFFILLSRNFDALKNLLATEKFVEGEDFVNAMDFLSQLQGKPPLDTYFLIKAI